MLVSSERIVKATISSTNVRPVWLFPLITARPLLYLHRQLTESHADGLLLRILERRFADGNGAGTLSDGDEVQRGDDSRSGHARRSGQTGNRDGRLSAVVADVFH